MNISVSAKFSGGSRRSVLVFDVFEILFRLNRVAELFRVLGQPEGILSLYFAQVLRDGFAFEPLGVFRPFPAVAKGALIRLLGHEPATEAVLITS